MENHEKKTRKTEVENFMLTFAELQSNNEERANKLSEIDAETDELKEKASNVTEKSPQLQRDIELLKQMLGSLSVIPKSEQTSKPLRRATVLKNLHKLPEQVLVDKLNILFNDSLR